MNGLSNFIGALGLTLLVPGLAACDSAGEGEKKGTRGEAPAGKDPKQAPTVQATRVEVARVSPSTTSLRLVRPGEVESSRDANLAASMGGFIERLDAKVGDSVKKGEIIAKVDSSLIGAQVSLAKVEVKDAERELKRLKSMGKSVAQVRVDAAQTRVERAKAQLRVTSIQSGRTYVKAPFDGIIASAPMERGEVAPPGMTIVRIVQLDPAVISVAVTDRDVSSLRVGGEALVTAGGQVKPLLGSIARIDPTADLKTRSFNVEVEVANPDAKIKPGMIASVDFRQATSEAQIIIPQDFLVTKRQSNGVFVVDGDSVARWRELEVGAVVRDQVVIDSGLNAGERVIVVGHRSLADGDKLIISREGECCTEGRITYPGDNPVAVAPTTAEADAAGDMQ